MRDQQSSDRQILEFESRFYRHRGAKVAAMRDELDLRETAYWQRLLGILDDPAPELAREFGPLLARLRRVLDARVGQKLARSA